MWGGDNFNKDLESDIFWSMGDGESANSDPDSDIEVWGHTVDVAAAVCVGMYGQLVIRGSVMVRLVSKCCINGMY